MESLNGTQTAALTTQEEKLAALREEWASFDAETQGAIKSVAEIHFRGEYSTSNGKYFHRMVNGADGLPQRQTIPELVEAQWRRWGLPEPEITIPHLRRYVAWLRDNQRRERWNVFKEGLPRHRDCTLENYVAATDGQQEALAAISGYCERMTEHVAEGQGIILNGPVGTGKTHLLVGAAQGDWGPFSRGLPERPAAIQRFPFPHGHQGRPERTVHAESPCGTRHLDFG